MISRAQILKWFESSAVRVLTTLDLLPKGMLLFPLVTRSVEINGLGDFLVFYRISYGFPFCRKTISGNILGIRSIIPARKSLDFKRYRQVNQEIFDLLGLEKLRDHEKLLFYYLAKERDFALGQIIVAQLIGEDVYYLYSFDKGLELLFDQIVEIKEKMANQIFHTSREEGDVVGKIDLKRLKEEINRFKPSCPCGGYHKS